MGSAEERGGVRKAFRGVAIGAVVVFAGLVAGFGVGYYFRDKKVQELELLVAGQKEQLASMEKKVLEAQKSQLERALARAKVELGVEGLLGSPGAAEGARG